MLEWLIKIDEKLMLLFNNWHSPVWDQIMIMATNRFFWIPFYISIVVFLIWRYKKDSILIIVSIALLVICSDILTSWIMKPLFERLRPCHNESLKGLLRVINGCGGKYGFVSSHASNTFALVTFLVLVLRKNYPLVYLLFIWCFLVSYSRIYLGVHYPADISVGAFVGMTLAYSFHTAFQKGEPEAKGIL